MHEAPPKTEPPDRPVEQSDDVVCMTPVRPARRSLLRVAMQAAALLAVGSLLGLLVYRVIESSRGSNLVAAIKADKKPVAPDFHHQVIWPHFETWPDSLQKLRASETISPRDLKGYPVVMNFWASWCVPCKREAPRLNASAARHRGQVVFLGVDVQDFSADAVRFLRRHEANYVSVRARDRETYEDYGLTGLPETYFLDARGRIVAHSVGEITPSGLEEGIAQTLRAAE
jgi:cytochrome c biogenesis protein CcmG, thiol:disulfide interchange protein DsbE